MCKVPSLVFMALLGSASVLLAAQAPAKRPEPCTLATGDSPVAKACKEGGIVAAKAKMKDLLKEGRAVGVKHDCDHCHIADDDYSKLVQGAEEKFKKLLDAIAKKKS